MPKVFYFRRQHRDRVKASTPTPEFNSPEVPTTSIPECKSGENLVRYEEDTISCHSENTQKRDNCSPSLPSRKTDDALNLVDTASSKSNALLRRRVTFAVDRGNALTFNTNENPDLILLDNLQKEVSQMHLALREERVVRKKKERNLIKLAKELNLRSRDLTKNNEEIKKLAHTNSSLESRLSAIAFELESERSKKDQGFHRYKTKIESQEAKYLETCRDLDCKVDTINTVHSKECQTLKESLSKANMEVERLRGLLTTTEMRLIDSEPTCGRFYRFFFNKCYHYFHSTS